MQHKRGDSFDFLASIPPSLVDGYFAGWKVNAQIRTLKYDKLVDTLECEWVDPAVTRTLRLQKMETESWPVGEAIMDVQFTDPRQVPPYVISTTSQKLDIVRDVTSPLGK
jgi:hypothetical protein